MVIIKVSNERIFKMRTTSLITAAVISVVIAGNVYSDGSAAKGVSPKTGSTISAASISEKNTSKTDTLVVKARLVEIAGKLPANEIYNYVYIMKYRVVSVENGTCQDKEILVGQYNPLIARNMIKDKMDKYVNGNVKQFVVGEKHLLKLISPVESVWKDAVEDEYIDLDTDRYFAIETNIAE